MRMIPYHDAQGQLLGHFDAGPGYRLSDMNYDIIRLYDHDVKAARYQPNKVVATADFYDFRREEIEFNDGVNVWKQGLWIVRDSLPQWLFDRSIAVHFLPTQLHYPARKLRMGVLR